MSQLKRNWAFIILFEHNRLDRDYRVRKSVRACSNHVYMDAVLLELKKVLLEL